MDSRQWVLKHQKISSSGWVLFQWNWNWHDCKQMLFSVIAHICILEYTWIVLYWTADYKCTELILILVLVIMQDNDNLWCDSGRRWEYCWSRWSPAIYGGYRLNGGYQPYWLFNGRPKVPNEQKPPNSAEESTSLTRQGQLDTQIDDNNEIK